MLQIATQCQPTCGLVGIGTVPELERRRGDLSKLSNEHPLKPLIELCLKDDYKKRPDIRKVHDLIISLYEAIQEHSTDEVSLNVKLEYFYILEWIDFYTYNCCLSKKCVSVLSHQWTLDLLHPLMSTEDPDELMGGA